MKIYPLIPMSAVPDKPETDPQPNGSDLLASGVAAEEARDKIAAETNLDPATVSELADKSRMSLEQLNAMTAAAGAGKELPSQMDQISSASDAPPSRQEFVSLLARVIALEEKAASGPK